MIYTCEWQGLLWATVALPFCIQSVWRSEIVACCRRLHAIQRRRGRAKKKKDCCVMVCSAAAQGLGWRVGYAVAAARLACALPGEAGEAVRARICTRSPLVSAS